MLDYRAYPVLYVDDEPQNLVAFRYAFDQRFDVHTATSAAEALGLLRDLEVAVLLADQRMPDVTGVELCARVRELQPNAVRMIVTAYSDLAVAVDAINHGHVARYLRKPWENDSLAEAIGIAIELVHSQQTARSLQAKLLRDGPANSVLTAHEEIAHELASPLNALLVNGELIEEFFEALGHRGSGDPMHKLATDAREAHLDSMTSLRQLRSLVDRLRGGQRLSRPPHAGHCNVLRVAETTVRILRAELDPRIQLELGGAQDTAVMMEASALAQVVMNLVLNAAQALREAQAEEPRIWIGVSPCAQTVLLTIADNGPGIALADRRRVCEPYYTTRSDGTGLGLSIVQELMRSVGGRIQVEKHPSGGAQVEVTLPTRLD